ncbi:hypothetical protein ACQ4PT_005609 [Festuca glaucescens]
METQTLQLFLSTARTMETIPSFHLPPCSRDDADAVPFLLHHRSLPRINDRTSVGRGNVGCDRLPDALGNVSWRTCKAIRMPEQGADDEDGEARALQYCGRQSGHLRLEPMADGCGGEGGGDGGGSAEWLPIFHRVEAMVSKSQAQTEVLAADCARLEAADRVQRESWEVARRLQRSVDELQAAAREKDAEMDMLRSEAADARKKLQADATRKMTWEAAYVELLLGANQKLAELRDSDLEDSRTCAETPNSKEVGRRAKLNQDAVDHIASDLSADLRKLKQAYETLSSKKDKEVSALLSEKDSVRNQLDIMQQDYAKLLKNKEVEAAQATEAALKLQKSVDELKVLAQKKDVEIDRLQAEAVEAKKNHDKDLCALVSEKDCVHNQLSIMQQDYTKLLKNKEVLTQKKDHEIVILRAEAIGAKMKVQKMHSLVKEKDAEIQRLKGWHVESVQKHYKDMSETHKKSRSVDPAVTRRDKLKNSNRRQTVEEDYISETKTVEKDGQEETTQKRRRASSMSNDCEMSGSDQDSDEQSESDEDGDKQSERDEDGDTQTSDENSDEQSRSGGDDDHDGQSRSDEHDEDEHSQSGSDKETTNNLILKLPGNHKRKRDACNAESANGKSHSERNLVAKRRWSYSYEPPPSPLRRQRLVTSHGHHRMRSTGN